MTILAALNRAYDRMAEQGNVPSFGYSYQKIGFLISLKENGAPAVPPIDLRQTEGKKQVAPPMPVPQPVKRTSAIAPNFLWDKTSYALGVTAGEGKRLEDEHRAFVERHERDLADIDDPGLLAILRFLRSWQPECFEEWQWPEEMKDQNIVFALESERRQDIRIHDRPAAKALWAKLAAQGNKMEAVCLVSGEKAPIARLHPAIKGVWGAQSSGASIVSFNLDAFTSYGHDQGNNAPISEEATFAYTTVLNKFLASDTNRIQIGDTSTVFWADGSEAKVVEGIMSAMFGDAEDKIDERSEAEKVRDILKQLRAGRRLEEFDPHLAKDVRFYVLGLAPNSARIAIRFWLEDSFGKLAENYQRFLSDMEVRPRPEWAENAPLWRYLLQTAVQHKRENVPPNLAGEWMRAILTGTNYPLTLLSTVLMRLRADKDINALRAAILKAVLVRNFRLEVPVSLDPENTDKGYLLGRLFAVYEQAQTAAIGQNTNATIKDKFYGSASAQPRKVFPILESGSANHLAKIGKQSPGHRVNLEKTIAGIMDQMSPSDDPFPTSLSNQQQALFGLGYYHQRNEFFRKSETSETSTTGEAAE